MIRYLIHNICIVILLTLSHSMFAQTCSDIMNNGDFETGGNGWNSSSTATLGSLQQNLLASGETNVNSNMPRGGTMSAELGSYGGTPPAVVGQGPPYTSSINRSITIDQTTGATVELTMWVKFDACNLASDNLTLYLDGTSALVLNGNDAFCGDGLWHEYVIDVTPFVSSNLMNFKFEAIENGNSPTTFYIDDVVLEECIPAPPSCPGSQFVIGAITGSQDYETDGSVLVINATFSSTAIVDLDAGTEITIGGSNTEVTIPLGAQLCAFIDGCNGTGGIVNPVNGSDNNNLSDDEDSTIKEDKVQVIKKQ